MAHVLRFVMTQLGAGLSVAHTIFYCAFVMLKLQSIIIMKTESSV